MLNHSGRSRWSSQTFRSAGIMLAFGLRVMCLIVQAQKTRSLRRVLSSREAVQRSKRGPNGVEVWAWKMSTKSQRILRVQ